MLMVLVYIECFPKQTGSTRHMLRCGTCADRYFFSGPSFLLTRALMPHNPKTHFFDQNESVSCNQQIPWPRRTKKKHHIILQKQRHSPDFGLDFDQSECSFSAFLPCSSLELLGLITRKLILIETKMQPVEQTPHGPGEIKNHHIHCKTKMAF